MAENTWSSNDLIVEDLSNFFGTTFCECPFSIENMIINTFKNKSAI